MSPLTFFNSNPKPLVILSAEVCLELELCAQGNDGQWSVLLLNQIIREPKHHSNHCITWKCLSPAHSMFICHVVAISGTSDSQTLTNEWQVTLHKILMHLVSARCGASQEINFPGCS